MHYIPFLSTLVTFAFAIAVFRRYLVRHGTHLLIWTIGLVWYGLGTLSEVILGLTFSGLVLKLWYLCGAMLTAAWLGQGTLHLLVRRGRVAGILTGVLAAVSVLAAALILLAPLTPAATTYRVAQPISSQYQAILTLQRRNHHPDHYPQHLRDTDLVRRGDLLGLSLLAQARVVQPHDRQHPDRRRRAGPCHGRLVHQDRPGRYALFN